MIITLTCLTIWVALLVQPGYMPSLDDAAAAQGTALRSNWFVPNRGQWGGQWGDDSVSFGLRSRGLDVAARESALTIHMQPEFRRFKLPSDAMGLSHFLPWKPRFKPRNRVECSEPLTLTVEFPGSNPVKPRGAEPQSARVHYFRGVDETKWQRNLPTFGRLVYDELYAGIDLHVMSSNDSLLKYEFRCQPGALHSLIRVQYQGAESLRIDKSGRLIVETPLGTLRDAAPLVWQEIDGTRDFIPARFELCDEHTYTIRLIEPADPTREIIIDPEVEWMSYLGGSEVDWAFGVAIDDAQGALVSGDTGSMDFEGHNNTYRGSTDVFIARIDASGSVDWVTYLGGTGFDLGRGMALDSAGNALVTGWTQSADFAGANNTYHGGSLDSFVVRVTPEGLLDWMTYLGGTADDLGFDIAAGDADSAFVTGQAYSTNFDGANNAHHGGAHDAFVARIDATGTIDWMTYLGGSGGEAGAGIAVDADGAALVMGDTWSTNFEGRNNSIHGNIDAFIARVLPTGTVDWMTYLGGSENEAGYSIAVDERGAALAGGATVSTNFAGALNQHHGGASAIDAFLARVPASGTIEWMVYLGGSGDERALGVATNADGEAFVSGRTESADFEGRENAFFGVVDAYIARISPAGVLDWMTYLGGAGDDAGFGVALDSDGAALQVGRTNSSDFEGALNDFHGGPSWGDAFILKVPAAETHAADLTDVEIAKGILLSGGVDELGASDDEILRTRSELGLFASEPNVMEMIVGAMTTANTAKTIDLTIESRIDHPSGTARIALRDWNTGKFLLIGEYGIGPEETIEVFDNVDATNFLRTDGRIELSVEHVVVATFTASGFDSSFDWVEITVGG